MNKVFSSKQSVFNLQDLGRILWVQNYNNLKSRISYYEKRWYIERIRRGIYIKEDYNIYELACKIYSPSYISFETALQKEGIIYQNDTTVYVASYLSRNISIKWKNTSIHICYRKLRDDVLYDTLWIHSYENYSIATPERAIQDMKYLKKDFYFDNLKNYEYKTP